VLTTADGKATFVTTQLRTLQRGQARIDIPIRASDASKGPVGVVAAGAISTLSQAISGVSRVTNFDVTVLGANDETDDELRARAKAAVQTLGKGTVLALEGVVFGERAKLDSIREHDTDTTVPFGAVSLLVETKPERFIGLNALIQQTRAAGVEATVVAKYVFLKPRLVGTLQKVQTAAGSLKIVTQAIAAMQQYIDTLDAGSPALASELLAAINKNVPELSDPKSVTFVDALVSHTEVNQATATQADLVVNAIQGIPSTDTVSLRTAIQQALQTDMPPAFNPNRVVDRTLVKTTGSPAAQATDQDIEAGQFQIVTPPDGVWSIVLDASPADIFLQGP
jgi:baseplate J-like protein